MDKNGSTWVRWGKVDWVDDKFGKKMGLSWIQLVCMRKSETKKDQNCTKKATIYQFSINDC